METNLPERAPFVVADEAAAPPVKTRRAARVGDGTRTSRRGFASMDPAQQRRIASQGGRASHASGQGHKWTAEEAREAGRKGGLTSRRGPSTTTKATATAKAKASKTSSNGSKAAKVKSNARGA